MNDKNTRILKKAEISNFKVQFQHSLGNTNIRTQHCNQVQSTFKICTSTRQAAQVDGWVQPFYNYSKLPATPAKCHVTPVIAITHLTR